ncbi:MAG: glycosyltransferase family 2 protein [Candidatus Scalindua rubra]|uniref:Putative glycosyl transferase n=1 Tax=Candidatus Scalindua brodae TaxID=237368 RepID=A0A0B0EMT0_9BACT|nr:MAG: putative glycosyl transferase [Candidatus Scalindua brodae]MBZ0109946.1 glycosyltransferase family 2 protein [Candidatus Scalindua rubra]TWU35480.1 N-acetylglucosaminyl-diphospho-decaprenol L-rhamnosyltransferase [Candidatus Brocadiaceae bacterium S225]
MNHSEITILIISFNCWHYLDPCLSSIYNSDYSDFNIIIIDNNSMDGTLEKIHEKYPQVQLVKNTVNVGHTKAVNQGCRLVKNGHILLLDADVELKPDVIGKMFEYLKQHPNIWMVAPKTLNTDGTVQESARNFPSEINGIFGRQSILTRRFPNNPFSRRYLDHYNFAVRKHGPYQVQHVSAACMMFSKKTYDTIGEWDEEYHSYWVDADWCKRLQKAGGSIFFLPGAVITHHDNNKRSLKKNPLRIVNFHRGVYRFYCLHYTYGFSDPRRLIASVLLTFRATFHLIINAFKKASNASQDPLSVKDKK